MKCRKERELRHPVNTEATKSRTVTDQDARFVNWRFGNAQGGAGFGGNCPSWLRIEKLGQKKLDHDLSTSGHSNAR